MSTFILKKVCIPLLFFDFFCREVKSEISSESKLFGFTSLFLSVKYPRCNNPIFDKIILIIYHVCLYVLVCDYLSLCIFYSGLVDFGSRRVF